MWILTRHEKDCPRFPSLCQSTRSADFIHPVHSRPRPRHHRRHSFILLRSVQTGQRDRFSEGRRHPLPCRPPGFDRYCWHSLAHLVTHSPRRDSDLPGCSAGFAVPHGSLVVQLVGIFCRHCDVQHSGPECIRPAGYVGHYGNDCHLHVHDSRTFGAIVAGPADANAAAAGGSLESGEQAEPGQCGRFACAEVVLACLKQF